MGFFDNFFDFIHGKKNPPIERDMMYNIQLLNEAKKLIEIGIFVRFFKKPFIGLIEIIIYSLAIFLAFSGYWIYHVIDNNLVTIGNVLSIANLLFDQNINLGFISFIEFLLFIFFQLPSIFCFLFGRIFTNARRRINIFIEVEKIIDVVIDNLKSIERKD